MIRAIIGLFIILASTSQTYAQKNDQPYRIVIDVFSTLVQGFQEKHPLYKSSGRQHTEVNHSAYIFYPHARDVLANLFKDPRYEVYFYVGNQEKVATEIFQAIPLESDDKFLMNYITDHHRLLSKTADGPLSLTSLGFDPNHTLFITSEKKSDLSGNEGVSVAQLGKWLYFFDSFYKCEKFKRAFGFALATKNKGLEALLDDPAGAFLSKKASQVDINKFPADDEEWYRSNHQWAILYNALTQFDLSTPQQFASLLNKVLLDAKATHFSMDWLKKDYVMAYSKLEVADGKIIGCTDFTTDLAQSKFVEGTKNAAPIEHCLTDTKANAYAWMEPEQVTCGLFVYKYFYKEAPKKLCETTAKVAVLRKNFFELIDLSILFTFNHLNALPTYKDGVGYPRLDWPLFRGIKENSPHYNLPRILRGLLGDPSSVLESKVLNLKKDEYIKAGDSEYTALIRSANDLKDYFTKQKEEDLKGFYTVPTSGKYKNRTDDAIFATLYFGVTTHYSSAMVVSMHDRQQRGIDLNYVMNAFGEQNISIDAGEYLYPMLIANSDIDGVMMNKMNRQFFSVNDSGKDYVLVYKDQPCLIRERNKVYICDGTRNLSTYKLYEPKPKTETEATAFAVIGTCPNNQTCKLPKGFLARHQVIPLAEEAIDLDLPALSFRDLHAELYLAE